MRKTDAFCPSVTRPVLPCHFWNGIPARGPADSGPTADGGKAGRWEGTSLPGTCLNSLSHARHNSLPRDPFKHP